jgi:predicted Zn-ribbon and HTH transcriptional regulator
VLLALLVLAAEIVESIVVPAARISDGALILVPLLTILGILGLATTATWWRERLPKPGQCRGCRYDLTGNTSGICPECGSAFTPPEPVRCQRCGYDLTGNQAGRCPACGAPSER